VDLYIVLLPQARRYPGDLSLDTGYRLIENEFQLNDKHWAVVVKRQRRVVACHCFLEVLTDLRSDAV
jgi:hypothetical protein